MDAQQRIAQFENMVASDPENDMAHYSLAGAYSQLGRHEESATSYLRCTEVNPTFSKAYQLAAAELIKAGKPDQAGDVLVRGYTIASERGELMPKKAMGELLEKLGRPVPVVATKGAAVVARAPIVEGGFACAKTGRPGTKMIKPPFKGPVGEWIAENISKETFNEWIAQGTKVINELRLDLSNDEHNETYDRYMREYLGMDEATYEKIQRREA